MHVRHLPTNGASLRAALSGYDVAPETIAAFKDAIGETLLPAQELAVREGLLDGSPAAENLLIAAPTSAGKTFLAELSAVPAAQRGQRVFYLVPLKAMAEEAFRVFQRRYGRLDLKVVISTRDRREFDQHIERGEFHIAIMVYEKLQSLLVTRPELLSQVGLVIVDELQMLTDQGRGPRLELLLTKIRRAQRCSADGGPRLLCLSAPLGGLDELGRWLGAHVIVNERRPVELRAGVLHRGRFTYRSSREGGHEEELPGLEGRAEEEIYADAGDKEGRDPQRQVVRAVAALAARGEQTLVFVPDRARCVELSREIYSAAGLACPPAPAALDEIAATDEGQARQVLLDTLQKGVAFHNSDLTQAQREVVERAFRSGEIRVLCATSTLAMGVNLPARNVILAERWRWRYSRRYNKWVRDELTKTEYDGMSGRAGRLGLSDTFGRSLLVAPSRFDAEVWLRTLVCAPLQDLQPTLLGKPLGDVVLDLVASGLCRDQTEVIDFLLATYTGHARWSLSPGQQAFAQSVHLTIEELVHNDLLNSDEDGVLRITAVGRVCARKGLMVRSAVLMSRWAEAAAPAEVQFTALEVLLVCALTPDGGEAHVPLSLPEHRFGDYWTRILLKAQEVGAADRRLFRWLRDQRGRLTYEQTKSVKKALLLLDWVEDHNTAEIERDHSVWSGAVSHAAADFAWLLDALAELCDARGWPSERTASLLTLGERLRYGVDGQLVPLARATSAVLSRTQLQRVAAAGVKTEEGLMEADAQTLEKAVGHRAILQKIYQIQAARKAAAAQRQQASPAATPVPAPAARLAQVLPLPLVAQQRPGPEEHPEVDHAAVELGEPGRGARLVPQAHKAAVTPAGADLPLDQVSVTGRPLAPDVAAAAPAGAGASLAAMADLLAAATAQPAAAVQLPLLRPVIVVPTAPEARRAAPGPVELTLTAETGPRRCYLQIGGERVPVSPGSFALLARLALGLTPAGEAQPGEAAPRGWVDGGLLGKTHSGVRKSISRLRAELRQVNIEARSWIENDGQGRYRLSLSAPQVVFDKEALRQHPLATIRNMLRAA